MYRQMRNEVPGDDSEMLIRLTNLLESSCLQKLSVSSSFPSSSSSSLRYAVTDSSSGRNSCGKNASSSFKVNTADMLDYGGSRNQHKRSKDKSVATSECNDDRDYLPTSSAISFKSWQSKVGTSSSIASNVNKGNSTKGIMGSMNGPRFRVVDGFQQSGQQDSKRWSNFLDRVNEKEKEKRRGIKVEKRRIDLIEGAECFFSPNLTTKSLKMAASFDQLKDRIPHMLSAREDFLEQQRQILIKKEADECTFSPLRQSADRGDFYLQNPSSSSISLSLPLSDYKPYLMEKTRKEDILRSQLAERDAHELTFQPRTNAAKYLSASVARKLKVARTMTDKDKEGDKDKVKDKERDKGRRRETDTALTGRGRDRNRNWDTDQGQGQSNVLEVPSLGVSKGQRALARDSVRPEGEVSREREREKGRKREEEEVVESQPYRDDESMSDGSQSDGINLNALCSSAHSMKQRQTQRERERERESPTAANSDSKSNSNSNSNNNNYNNCSGSGSGSDSGVNERNSLSGDCSDGNVSSDHCSNNNNNSSSSRNRDRDSKNKSKSCIADTLHCASDSDSYSHPDDDPPHTTTMTPTASATYDTIRLRDLSDEEEEGEEEDNSHLPGQGQRQGGAASASVSVSVRHSCHERLYQLGLEHWTRLDEIHQRACSKDSLLPPASPSPLLTPSRQVPVSVSAWDRLHKDSHSQRKARSSAYTESERDSSTFAQRLRTPSSRANVMVSAAKPSCRPRPRSSVSVSSFHATNKRGGHAQVHRARGSRRAGTGVKALGWSDSGTRSVKKRVADKSVMRDEKEEEESGGSDSEVQGDDAAESHADYVAVVNCNPKEGAADRDGEYSQQLRRLWCDLLDC